MKVVNYSDLRLNLKHWLDLVVDDFEELIITRKNRKDLILIPLEEYNALKETNYLLTGKNGKRLLKSIEDSKAGKTTSHDLIEE